MDECNFCCFTNKYALVNVSCFFDYDGGGVMGTQQEQLILLLLPLSPVLLLPARLLLLLLDTTLWPSMRVLIIVSFNNDHAS